MLDYRLYFLDAAGHITHARELECDGDEHALRLAADHPSAHLRELWQLARRVAVLEPDSSLAAESGADGEGA